MNTNKITVKGTAYGIRGELTKRILLILTYVVIFFITNSYRKTFFAKYKLSTILDFIADNITSTGKLIALLVIFILYISLVLLTLSSIMKIIKLFYYIKRQITVDYIQGKITRTRYGFPFSKNVEEDKFEKIITVSVRQNLMDRIFNSGSLYIEYLVTSSVESSTISFIIPFVYDPSVVMEKLLEQ